MKHNSYTGFWSDTFVAHIYSLGQGNVSNLARYYADNALYAWEICIANGPYDKICVCIKRFNYQMDEPIFN